MRNSGMSTGGCNQFCIGWEPLGYLLKNINFDLRKNQEADAGLLNNGKELKTNGVLPKP